MAYEKVSRYHDTWQPEQEGDEIEGIYTTKKEGLGEQGKSILYTLETDKGIKTFWGSTMLNDFMNAISFGSQIKVVYKGIQQLARGRKLKLFEVFIDRDIDEELGDLEELE